MPSKTESKSDKVSSKTKANKSATQYQYAYVFNVKRNHCIVGVSSDHPETTVFNDLKHYYGNDIKGAYYKCSKSTEEIKAGIKFKLSKEYLTEILYNKSFSDTKKVLLEVTGLKHCTGTINVYKEKESDCVDENTKHATNSDADAEESGSESEKEDEKVVVKEKSKSKSKQEAEPETKSKGKVKETEKESKESKSKTPSKPKVSKKIEVEESESESESESEPEIKASTKKTSVKDSKTKKTDTKKSDIQPKKNATSIELSDESEEEDEN